jgi:hypothetical protein
VVALPVVLPQTHRAHAAAAGADQRHVSAARAGIRGTRWRRIEPQDAHGQDDARPTRRREYA